MYSVAIVRIQNSVLASIFREKRIVSLKIDKNNSSHMPMGIKKSKNLKNCSLVAAIFKVCTGVLESYCDLKI